MTPGALVKKKTHKRAMLFVEPSWSCSKASGELVDGDVGLVVATASIRAGDERVSDVSVTDWAYVVGSNGIGWVAHHLLVRVIE